MRILLSIFLCLIIPSKVFSDELSQLKFEQAVRYKDWKVAEALLPEVSIDQRNKYGENALIIATKEGHAPFVKWLIENGANFDAKAKYGNKIINVAASNGHHDVLKVLLENGADINGSNPHGGTPLILAVNNGHIHTVKYLVRHGADINKSNKALTPLIKALMNKEYQIAQFLIDSGAYYGNGKDEYGPTGDPIRHATNAPIELFETLIKNSTPRISDLRGHPPLVHWVAKTGSIRKLQLLEESGYDLKAKDFRGNSALNQLKSSKYDEVRSYLLSKGVAE